MEVSDTIAGARAALRGQADVGFVPTMGALHAGHARLIQTAREWCGFVAVSLFVNPTQFDQKEDYERYARTLNADLELCGRCGADLVFAPSVEEMYPKPAGTTFVEVGGLGDHFCGESRPGHFRAVATVVAKLFHIVQPDTAFFGEKDAQQLAVIRRMVRDLNFPIRIVPVATVREEGGLAMSSRNVRLSAEERERALSLYRALTAAREMIESGERSVAAIEQRGRRILEDAGVRVDYFNLADPETMRPAERIERDVLAMGAIFAGGTRLIDNMLCPLT